MGPRPLGLSIERIDVNGDYCKENCKWIPSLDQPLNTRRSVMLEVDGKRQSTAAWAREKELSAGLIYRRIKSGWPIERLFIPPTRQPQRKAEATM